MRGTKVSAAIAIATAGVLLAGCASKNTAASSGQPPKLLIGTGTSEGVAAAPMMAAGAVPKSGAAIAPQPIGGFGGFGGYTLTGTLPSTPTHAPIWTWQSGKASESDVTKLAAALGLTGTPVRHAYGWELSTSTGELRVRDGDGEQWSYDRADSVACPSYQTDIDNADGASVGFGCAIAAPAPVATPGSTTSGPTLSLVAPVQGPDEAATKAAAASLLGALGVTGTEQFNNSSPASTLTIAPLVDGMPTQGIETNVDVDAKGIRAAAGRLVAPKAGTDYPLQTAAAAFKSLADRPMPMIAQYCGPLPVDGGPVPPVPVASGPNTKFPLNPAASASATGPNVKFPLNPAASAPAAPASGPNVKFPLNPAASESPNTVLVASPPPAPDSAAASAPVESSYPCPTPTPEKVTGAVIGLQVEYNASGATTNSDGATVGGTNILVPTWFFTVADSTYPLTVIAVDPSFLGDQNPIPPIAVASAGATSGGFTGSGGGAAGSAIAVPPVPASAAVGPALPPAPTAKPSS